MAGTIIAITAAVAVAASVTTAIAASTATIAAAVAIACGDGGAGLSLVEAVGGDFAAFGELFVDDVLFGVRLVEILVLIGFIDTGEIIDGGVVDAVLFLEVVLISSSSTFGAGAGDLVDGHLADHSAEIGGAFEGLFFFEVVHLFDGAGVKSGVVVLFVEGLFYECAGAGDGGCSGRVGGDVAGGVDCGELVGIGS